MSFGRQIIAAFVAAVLCSIVGLAITMADAAFFVVSSGEGDPKVLAGIVSQEIVTSILSLIPFMVFGLVFWRILFWASLRVFGQSRSLKRQLLLGGATFAFLLAFGALINFTLENDIALTGVYLFDAFYWLAMSLVWGVVFWFFIRKPKVAEDFA